MFMIALLGLLMITMSGSFFMGKVGGAESASGLARDLREVFGARITAPDTLTIRVVTDVEGAKGLVIAFTPSPEVVGKKALDFMLQRMVDFVRSQEHWRKTAKFIQFDLVLPGDKSDTRRYALTRIGG
jgi:hypothetical protein